MMFSRLGLALRAATVLVLLTLIAADVRANMLPMTDLTQFASRKLDILACLTTGSYDVRSMIWTQHASADRCSPYPVIPGPGGTYLSMTGFEASLVGRVDKDGNALGGVFTLFGALPDLGIDQRMLLIRGSLAEANYGPPLLTESIRSSIGPNALIEVDFALPIFGNAGDFLLWQPNALVRGWNYPPWQFPEAMPWHSSVGEADYHNYTNSQFKLYDRSVFFAPEPATLPLLGLGLWVVLVAARSRRQGAR